MRRDKSVTLMCVVLAVFIGFLVAPTPTFAASREQVLYSFCPVSGCLDGGLPLARLLLDAAGNLYGTTLRGGGTGCNGYGCGTVFELTPEAGGTWTETILYGFCSLTNCADGAYPYAGLVFDAAGNLYGTTAGGGNNTCEGGGCGTVFELTPGANGTWTEKVLYNFCPASGCADGYSPLSGVIFGADGNLYGATTEGGAYGNGGTVYQLTPQPDGTWAAAVLYSFCSVPHCLDGVYPWGLVFDAAGNLYGTANAGGLKGGNCTAGCGTVFELIPRGSGKWREKTLFQFTANGKHGELPNAGLVVDAAGNLYGTAAFGGRDGGQGTIFELTPNAKGRWTLEVIHTFHGEDGRTPEAGLIPDGVGNLYGTTSEGGSSSCGCGTVFELIPGTSDIWKAKVLHRFHNKDGHAPYADLTLDGAGNLYGTTLLGGNIGQDCGGNGSGGCGTVFEITP